MCKECTYEHDYKYSMGKNIPKHFFLYDLDSEL